MDHKSTEVDLLLFQGPIPRCTEDLLHIFSFPEVWVRSF